MAEEKEREVLELTQKVQQKAPNYFVRWNAIAKCWPDDLTGMFELWATDYEGNKSVHYRRRSYQEIIDLIR